jgi:hypothetical protein
MSTISSGCKNPCGESAARQEASPRGLKVEHPVAATRSGHAIGEETGRWVAKLEEWMSERLTAAGLVPSRASSTLQAFIAEYLAMRVFPEDDAYQGNPVPTVIIVAQHAKTANRS